MLNNRRFLPKAKGFTLVELLVVVGIIATLAAIMMPSLREVRRVSRLTVCKKGLDQVGLAMQSYLNSHGDRYPWACRLPSYEPEVAEVENRRPWPSIPEILKQEIKGGKEVFCCPADENTMSRSEIPTKRYYDHESTSYEWEHHLNGQKVDFKFARLYARAANKDHQLAVLQKTQMWMMFDFESFHGGRTLRSAQNILYADLHVDSDKWKEGGSPGGVTPPSPISMVPSFSY